MSKYIGLGDIGMFGESDAGEVKEYKIPLSKGYETIVDAEDYEELSKFKWHARNGKGKEQYTYAQRAATKEEKANGLPASMPMHRIIMGNPARKFYVDHINGNTLDNRRSNLRLATVAENVRNRRKNHGCSSKYKGVSVHKKNNRFHATITLNEKKLHIGTFDNPLEAAIAYDRAAIHLHGEFARLNFPDAATCELTSKLRADLEAEKKKVALLKMSVELKEKESDAYWNDLNTCVSALEKIKQGAWETQVWFGPAVGGKYPTRTEICYKEREKLMELAREALAKVGK